MSRGLWIGDVPQELKFDPVNEECLNLVESLLIALDFSRTFLVKLYTKTHHLPRDQRVTALKGNVVTYEMPAEDIQNMLDTNLLPHPPEVLASLLSIAWVGKGALPETHGVFNVSRDKIHAALKKAKAINPQYGHITISEERLNLYGKPGEVRQPESIQIRQLQHDQADAAAREGASYGVDTEEPDSLDKRSEAVWNRPDPVVSENRFAPLSTEEEGRVREDLMDLDEEPHYGTQYSASFARYSVCCQTHPKSSNLAFITLL